MLNHTELSFDVALERQRDMLDSAARDRRANACDRQLAFARRAARPLGRALFNAGAWLLRYGKVESAAPQRYRATARSIELN